MVATSPAPALLAHLALLWVAIWGPVGKIGPQYATWSRLLASLLGFWSAPAKGAAPPFGGPTVAPRSAAWLAGWPVCPLRAREGRCFDIAWVFTGEHPPRGPRTQLGPPLTLKIGARLLKRARQLRASSAPSPRDGHRPWPLAQLLRPAPSRQPVSKSAWRRADGYFSDRGGQQWIFGARN